MTTEEKLTATIVREFPASRNGRTGPIPPDLIGSRIIDIGTISDIHPEQCGLVIDFERVDGRKGRVLLAFTEVEMWVEAIAPRTPMPPDTFQGQRVG